MAATDEERARAFLRVLHARRGESCPDCGSVLCGHEFTMSAAMGFLDRPRCWDCLARLLDRDPVELREQLYDYIRWRPCFFSGWRAASEFEGYGVSTQPGCLWTDERPARIPRTPVDPALPPALDPSSRRVEAGEIPPAEDATWDAGDLACADLVLELRRRLSPLSPGRVLRVTATDPAAPEDLSAWCRLTGQVFAAQSPPVYWIRHERP